MGMRFAPRFGNRSGRFVMIMDADGSHNPDDFERLWSKRHEGDVIIGSRYTAGGQTKVHAGLTLQSQILNITYRRALGLKIRDMSNSFRLYRGDQLRALALISTNFEILEEILARLAWGPAKATILEVPITFEKRNAGREQAQSDRIYHHLPAIDSSFAAVPRRRAHGVTSSRTFHNGQGKCSSIL